MIQRKQTLWLFIAALLCAGLFYFDLYRAHTIVNGVDTIARLRINDHYPSLILALVITALPLLAIFMFGQRKQQRTVTIISILATIGFIALTLWRVNSFNSQTPAPASGSYWIGAILPLLAIIFLIMAIRGISKDIKLVKSLDRLR